MNQCLNDTSRSWIAPASSGSSSSRYPNQRLVRYSRSKSAVSNRLRLLELPEEVLWMLARGDMSEGHARAVLSLPDDEARRLLARRIVKEGLTVRAAERAAQEGGARRRPRRAAAAVDPALVDRARTAAEALTGMPSRVAAGTLQIRFEDEKGLAELVEALEVATTGLLADRAA